MGRAPLALPIFMLAVAIATCASAADRLALPDPLVTPGATNPAASLAALCGRPAAEQVKPALPPWVTEVELSSYNIPEARSADYELDYLIPLSIGGANTLSNVWLQPRAQADKKARLEAALRRRVCSAYKSLSPGMATQVLTNVQRDIAEDWTAAYASYVSAE